MIVASIRTAIAIPTPIASAFVTLMDGFLVRALEAGSLSVEEVRKEAYSLLELLLAAPSEVPSAVEGLRAQDNLRTVARAN
jgi:hypothetical protein